MNLTACQLVLGYYLIPTGSQITFILRSYLQFLYIYFLKAVLFVFFSHKPIEYELFFKQINLTPWRNG